MPRPTRLATAAIAVTTAFTFVLSGCGASSEATPAPETLRVALLRKMSSNLRHVSSRGLYEGLR